MLEKSPSNKMHHATETLMMVYVGAVIVWIIIAGYLNNYLL